MSSLSPRLTGSGLALWNKLSGPRLIGSGLALWFGKLSGPRLTGSGLALWEGIHGTVATGRDLKEGS